jgi:sugar diacid utilization regulator
MRDLQARMLAAVLGGEGLAGVAELASREAGGPVAILLPARGLAAAVPAAADGNGNGNGNGGARLSRLRDYVDARLEGRAAQTPPEVEAEEPVQAGDETVGAVLLLASAGNEPKLAIDRAEVLRAAALTCVAELAVTEARDAAAESLRGGLLEELREGPLDAEQATRRAARLGCGLDRGAVALVAEIHSSKPRHAAALIAGEHEGAIAEVVGERVYAILPARGGDEAAGSALASARGLVTRLRSDGPSAFSSFYPDPADLHQAIREAELVLEVISRDPRLADRLAGGADDAVYRLLLRALASNPDEVSSFYEDTVAPIVRYDRRYRSDLLPTLESYLDNDCNMNATARAIHAHRHTVAYRLERTRELSGLNPAASEDRERLGLGVKAFRILAPTLPR